MKEFQERREVEKKNINDRMASLRMEAERLGVANPSTSNAKPETEEERERRHQKIIDQANKGLEAIKQKRLEKEAQEGKVPALNPSPSQDISSPEERLDQLNNRKEEIEQELANLSQQANKLDMSIGQRSSVKMPYSDKMDDEEEEFDFDREKKRGEGQLQNLRLKTSGGEKQKDQIGNNKVQPPKPELNQTDNHPEKSGGQHQRSTSQTAAKFADDDGGLGGVEKNEDDKGTVEVVKRPEIVTKDTAIQVEAPAEKKENTVVSKEEKKDEKKVEDDFWGDTFKDDKKAPVKQPSEAKLTATTKPFSSKPQIQKPPEAQQKPKEAIIPQKPQDDDPFAEEKPKAATTTNKKEDDFFDWGDSPKKPAVQPQIIAKPAEVKKPEEPKKKEKDDIDFDDLLADVKPAKPVEEAKNKVQEQLTAKAQPEQPAKPAPQKPKIQDDNPDDDF